MTMKMAMAMEEDRGGVRTGGLKERGEMWMCSGNERGAMSRGWARHRHSSTGSYPVDLTWLDLTWALDNVCGLNFFALFFVFCFNYFGPRIERDLTLLYLDLTLLALTLLYLSWLDLILFDFTCLDFTWLEHSIMHVALIFLFCFFASCFNFFEPERE